MTQRALLISIRPRFAEKIFAGTKTVELRRVRPRVSAGDLVFVYVSSPIKELQGAFEVGRVITAAPSVLWKRLGKNAGVTHAEFRDYFSGKDLTHAIVIKRFWKLPVPLSLPELRQRTGGFRPPQSFRYICGLQFPISLGLGEMQPRMW
jgi:predicted transcriptional regulator